MFLPIDRARIRGESGCADETIRAYPNVRDASRRRIERACATLGIALPQAQSAASGDTSKSAA